MKKEKYFVSYSFVGGFGCCEVWKNQGGLDIKGTLKAIEKENPKQKDVIILYFKKFEKGEKY